MIRAGGKDERTGRAVVFLGLSDANVVRMAAGEPIHTTLDELGVDADVVIFGGYGDEDQLTSDLSEFVHQPNTDS